MDTGLTVRRRGMLNVSHGAADIPKSERSGGSKFNRLAGGRMRETEAGGMQHHLFALLAATVEAVADNRRVEAEPMGGVQAQLMRSAGKGGELYAAGSVGDSEFSPPGDSLFPVDRVVDL